MMTKAEYLTGKRERRTLRKRNKKKKCKFSQLFDYILMLSLLVGVFRGFKSKIVTDKQQNLAVTDEKQNRLGSPEKVTSVPVKPVTEAERCVRKLVGGKKQKDRQQILYIINGETLFNPLRVHNDKLNENGIFIASHLHCEVSKESVEAYYNLGVDLIMTSDHLYTSDEWQRFINDFVKRDKWEVRVLIEYMPLFDVINKEYYRIYTNLNRPRLGKWRKEGGIEIPSIVDYDWFQTMPPDLGVLSKNIQPYADRVLSYDTSKAPTGSKRKNHRVEFFCDLLEGAKAACEAQLELSKDSVEVYEQREHDIHLASKVIIDDIAMAAMNQGLIKSDISRYDAKKETESIYR